MQKSIMIPTNVPSSNTSAAPLRLSEPTTLLQNSSCSGPRAVFVLAEVPSRNNWLSHEGLPYKRFGGNSNPSKDMKHFIKQPYWALFFQKATLSLSNHIHTVGIASSMQTTLGPIKDLAPSHADGKPIPPKKFL